MPTQKFAGMNVLQPVGLLPRAANASRQPSSSQTAWTPHSQRLMAAPAIRPEPISRGQDGCCAITCSPKLLRTSPVAAAVFLLLVSDFVDRYIVTVRISNRERPH